MVQQRQLSLDDLGTPLIDTTFCVIDIETTGTAAHRGDTITEIGAVRYRGGERIGTFQSLVNPGTRIPPFITYLTGITEAMVAPAPPIQVVLPTLLEFVGDAVIVGHNVAFDLRFLRAAAQDLAYPGFTNRVIDTCSLARRLVRDEVANCKLHTLAERFNLPNSPSHRALDDALATGDLLHLLIERAAGYGVLGLDDLLELPRIGRHPQAAKLKLTNNLPRTPGVYVFRGASREILYVGKATNLRARVRSYFGSDDRKKVGPLLARTKRIDHLACSTTIEAAVVELRLIQRHLPPYNRVATQWPAYAYVRLDEHNGTMRATATRAPERDEWHLGPVASFGAARLAANALRMGAQELGLTGVAETRAALNRGTLFVPLAERMRALAAAEQFEEAAILRDRAGTLARAVQRQQRIDSIRRMGRLELTWRGVRLVSTNGLLHVPGARMPDGSAPTEYSDAPDLSDRDLPDRDRPIPRQLADELACFAAWLDRDGARARIAAAERPLVRPVASFPRFEPVRRPDLVPQPQTFASSASPAARRTTAQYEA